MREPDERAQAMIRIKARSIMATAKKLAEDETPSWYQLATLLQLDIGEIKEHLEPR